MMVVVSVKRSLGADVTATRDAFALAPAMYHTFAWMGEIAFGEKSPCVPPTSKKQGRRK
jgi:hypothetical protein